MKSTPAKFKRVGMPVIAMNKAIILAGIGIVAVSKFIIVKSILVDSPAYRECLTVAAACGLDPFAYFIAGWFATVGGFVLIVFGLRMPAARSISR
jgi:hypothetical protein